MGGRVWWSTTLPDGAGLTVGQAGPLLEAGIGFLQHHVSSGLVARDMSSNTRERAGPGRQGSSTGSLVVARLPRAIRLQAEAREQAATNMSSLLALLSYT